MVSEFQFIENLKAKYSMDKIGDDCAVLPKDVETDLLLTTDMLVEDIDFRLDWTTPEFLGHKALAVSLSDIAAMGGNPIWSMLSIGIPKALWNSDFLDEFYEGWYALANEYDVELVGGDVSKTPDKVVIDSIVGGEVAKGKAFLRSSAQRGDAAFVTGMLGGAAGGLKLLERGFRYAKDGLDHADLLLKQLKPRPQLNIAKQLQSLGIVTSMIDLSDGLSSDLEHICQMSGRGAHIYRDQLPINPDLIHHFPKDNCLDMALNGGEDFDLLFTVSEKNISLLKSLDVTCIGEMTTNIGIIELIDDNETSILQPKGYRHF